MAQPSTTNPPAPAGTPAPAESPKTKTEPKFTAAQFSTDFVKALGTQPIPPAVVDSLFEAYNGLGGQRDRASGLAMKAAIAAGHATTMGSLVATLDERLATVAGSKRTKVSVPPAEAFARSVWALDSAMGNLPIPEGLSAEEAGKIRSDIRAGTAVLPTEADVVAGIKKAAERAVSAVQRGSSINRGESVARKTGPGSAADHVASAVKTVKVGETMTVAQIVSHESSVYGPGDDHRPSPGAIRDTLAKKDGTVRSGATWIGVPNETAGQPVVGAKRTK